MSLVPSLTETVASVDRGLLVGATRYCTHPAGLEVARVGGTKNPDLAAIRALRPDLVLANEEENRPADLAELRARGLAVHVTWIRTLAQAFESLARLMDLLTGDGARPQWFEAARASWGRPPDRTIGRAVVPVWRRPWMALGRDTFAGDLLAPLGVRNMFAADPERYPRFDPRALPPLDLVVLPDEPYPFARADGPEAFPALPSALVSGRHLTWYGPSLAEARAVLAAQLHAAGDLPPDPAGWDHGGTSGDRSSRPREGGPP